MASQSSIGRRLNAKRAYIEGGRRAFPGNNSVTTEPTTPGHDTTMSLSLISLESDATIRPQSVELPLIGDPIDSLTQTSNLERSSKQQYVGAYIRTSRMLECAGSCIESQGLGTLTCGTQCGGVWAGYMQTSKGSSVVGSPCGMCN